MDREKQRAKNEAAMEYISAHPGSGRPEMWSEYLKRIAEGLVSGQLVADGDVGLADLAVMYCVGRVMAVKTLEAGRLPEREEAIGLIPVEVAARILAWCGADVFTAVMDGQGDDALPMVMQRNVKPRVHDRSGRVAGCAILWSPAEGDDNE